MADDNSTLPVGTIVIYGLLDEAGVVRYVGKSQRLPYRLRDHQRVFKWMVSHVILEIVSDGDWSACERKWIAHYSETHDLLNKNCGGVGGLSPSAETRAKMSASLKGHRVSQRTIEICRERNRSLAQRQKVSAARKGRPISIEQRTLLSNLRRGTKLTDEHKRKIGDKSRGRKHSEATKAKMKISRARQVIKPFTPEHRAKLGRPQDSALCASRWTAEMREAASVKRLGKKRGPYKKSSRKRNYPPGWKDSLKRSWTPERREQNRQRMVKQWATKKKEGIGCLPL